MRAPASSGEEMACNEQADSEGFGSCEKRREDSECSGIINGEQIILWMLMCIPLGVRCWCRCIPAINNASGLTSATHKSTVQMPWYKHSEHPCVNLALQCNPAARFLFPASSVLTPTANSGAASYMRACIATQIGYAYAT